MKILLGVVIAIAAPVLLLSPTLKIARAQNRSAISWSYKHWPVSPKATFFVPEISKKIDQSH